LWTSKPPAKTLMRPDEAEIPEFFGRDRGGRPHVTAKSRSFLHYRTMDSEKIGSGGKWLPSSALNRRILGAGSA